MSETLPDKVGPMPEPWSPVKRIAHEGKNFRGATEALENRDGEVFEAEVQYLLGFGSDEQDLRDNVVPVILRERIRIANLHLDAYDQPLGPRQRPKR